MSDFAIAVKTFIVSNDKVLLLKRNTDNSHKPGQWDIPGGRLEHGEDVRTGAAREAEEETGLIVDVLQPIDVHSFTRDDGQHITMIIFLCRMADENQKITLSHEHTEFEWKSISQNKNDFPDWLGETVNNFLKLK